METEMKNLALADITQQLWSTWDIRVFVLSSMALQCFLALSTFLRKRMSEGGFATLIRSALLLADWLTPYTIGLISNRQGTNGSSDPAAVVLHGDIMAFWAPFLLLHLSGPSSFKLNSLENDMGLWDAIRLISQTVSIVLIISRSETANPFFSATLAVFIAGTLRYSMRVQSLYFARLERSKESIATRVKLHTGPDYTGPNYKKLAEVQRSMREANLPTMVESVQLPPKKFKPYLLSLPAVELDFNIDRQLDENELLQFAQCFYNNFNGLFFGGVSYDQEQRQFTRNFFLRRSSADAFKLAEIELSIVHEHRFTKGAVKRRGILCGNIINLALVVYASVLFYQHDKQVLSKIDKGISYALVFGALFYETLALVRFALLALNVIPYNWVKPIAECLINTHKWSESLSKCSLISYCLRHRTPTLIIRRMIHGFCLGVALESVKFTRTVTSDAVSNPLKDTIFTELRKISELAPDIETATKICLQRGGWVLLRRYCYRQLKWSLGEVEYGHSLLLWHVATDLVCNRVCKCERGDSDSERRFCKDISEYLLYLLMAKPTMIAPAVGNWEKIFSDTFQDAERLFCSRSITEHKEACEAILSVNTDIEPVILVGDANASVLFEACRLAKQLLGFAEDNMWSLMSGVWMELLTYAAFHSEATVHKDQPNLGGELLTFVWLLMNHLGLGKQFREEPSRTVYRLVVKK